MNFYPGEKGGEKFQKRGKLPQLFSYWPNSKTLMFLICLFSIS
jgi:hypothetical protein